MRVVTRRRDDTAIARGLLTSVGRFRRRANAAHFANNLRQRAVE